jgi:chromosomal replication initiation ATPase DnaA
MLKRKSGNTFFTSPTKCVKPAPLKPKYQQQPLTFHKKPSHLKTQEKFSLHSQVSGILLSYLKDYKSRSKSYTSTLKSEKFLLIQGPAGCGKTFLVRDLASTLNLELLEINFSLSKSKASILRTIEQAASIFALETNGKTGSLIFIDDVDVLYELDDALFEGINSLMKNLKAPVFMTCTVIPKCLETSEHVKVYQLNSFKGFQEKSFVLVKEMCSDLKMVFPDNIIKNVISSTRGDLRKIVSLLGLNVLCT